MTSFTNLLVSVVVLYTFQASLDAQQTNATHPPDYPGVRTFIPGVFVTPVPGAPFTGEVEIISKQLMPDGSVYTRRTLNHIARNSAGTIHNERRQLEPLGFVGEPPLLSAHIYDPQTRLSTFFMPATHIAREITLVASPQAPANTSPATAIEPANAQNLRTEDLGVQTVAGIPLHGTRKQRTIPAAVSGTGHEITIADEYWYSEELKIYLVLKHKDPRTGEQIVGVVKVERGEPDPSLFQVPAGYKILDETPVPQARH